MARRALLVGINDYKGIKDLRGCINDVSNMRHILKTYLGFTNNDIRVLVDSRATKRAILYRLEYMVDKAEPGDFMVFHFSGHGSQIRDRSGDELEDRMDELICPYDMNWDGTFILDDDLDAILSRIPDGALLEVVMDCCHSATATRGSTGLCPGGGDALAPEAEDQIRFLEPPLDIQSRHDGEEEILGDKRGFRSINRSGGRSTRNHILWSGCMDRQQSADAYINNAFNGAFTYYFCKHMRDTGGAISRTNLLGRVRDSLRYGGYSQIPQLQCGPDGTCDGNPLQFPPPDEQQRMLYLTTPYMRGEDVKMVQVTLQKAGYRLEADGVFGPHTREVVKRFQRDNDLMVDGVVGPAMFTALLR